MLQLREAVVPLVELWDLMDSPAEERRGFQKAAAVLKPAKEEVLLSSGVLSMASIKKTEEEVERLTRLKAGRMKELVLKRRLELENICRSMHVEPDASTVPEKSIALIDSGTYSTTSSGFRRRLLVQFYYWERKNSDTPSFSLLVTEMHFRCGILMVIAS